MSSDPVRSRALRGLFVLADDDPRWPRDPVEQAKAACAGGASVVQLRAKHATDRVALAWASEIRACTNAASALFFLNDRFDLALAAEADGVHLGQEDIPPRRLPASVRSRLLVGYSTHSVEEARAARDEPVDYVAFGPVFGTTSKQSPHSARGLALLSEVVRCAAGRPVIAIGGIGAANAADVARAGAAGAAVISAIASAGDPAAAARAIAGAFEVAGRA